MTVNAYLKLLAPEHKRYGEALRKAYTNWEDDSIKLKLPYPDIKKFKGVSRNHANKIETHVSTLFYLHTELKDFKRELEDRYKQIKSEVKGLMAA